jgi:hypothetical protein
VIRINAFCVIRCRHGLHAERRVGSGPRCEVLHCGGQLSGLRRDVPDSSGNDLSKGTSSARWRLARASAYLR